MRNILRTCPSPVTGPKPAQNVLEVPDLPYRSPVPVHRRMSHRLCGQTTPGVAETEPVWTQRMGSGGVRPVLLGLRHMVHPERP